MRAIYDPVIAVRINPDHYREIELEAAKRGTKKSTIFRDAIAQFLENQKTEAA